MVCYRDGNLPGVSLSKAWSVTKAVLCQECLCHYNGWAGIQPKSHRKCSHHYESVCWPLWEDVRAKSSQQCIQWASNHRSFQAYVRGIIAPSETLTVAAVCCQAGWGSPWQGGQSCHTCDSHGHWEACRRSAAPRQRSNPAMWLSAYVSAVSLSIIMGYSAM